jgi:hypothetical protein
MTEAIQATTQSAERSYGGQTREYRTGDILLFSGKAFDSKIIRFGTKSSYSHAGIVYVWNGPDETGKSAEGPSTRSVPRVYVLEARGAQGVRLCLLSRLVNDKHYERIVYYRGTSLSDEQRNKAIGFAFAQLGKDYDHDGIRRFAWYVFMILVGMRKRMKPSAKRAQKTEKQVAKYRNDDMWFCSELVAAAYKHAGLEIAMQPDLTSPEDLVHLAPAGSRQRYFARDGALTPEPKALAASLKDPVDAAP